MNSRVEQLWKSYTDSVAQNTEKTKEQQKKLDRLKLHDIESIRKDLFDLKARVLSFENNHVSARQADQRVPHEALQQLISRVQKLEGAPSLTPRVDKLDSLLQELKDIHAFSDDLHFAEKEKIQRALEHQVIVSDRMTNDIARLSNQLQSVHQTNPNNQEIANLGANLHQTGNLTWRLPLWLQMLCPGIVCIFIWWVPESPRTLPHHVTRHERLADLRDRMVGRCRPI